MATLLQAIEDELGNLTTKVTFHYADLEEANATIFDKMKPSDFPVCLVLPFDITDSNRENGKVRSNAEVNAIFLNRFTNEQSIDKPASKIDSEFVAPMRTVAREFVNRLDDNDIIDEEGIDSVTNRSVYQPLGDAHLYGCWAVFTIKFWEGSVTCVD